MTDRGELTATEIAPNLGVKVLVVETPATFIGGTDSVTVDLGDYGCSKCYAIFATYQSTAGTVLAAATASISATSSGVITIGTSASGTGIYGIVIYAYWFVF